MKNREQVKQITEELQNGVKELFESERFQEYLDTAAKFHHYSALNCFLILRQFPEATRVAGFKAWQTKFHRNVKKGEKAIRILAPCPHKKVVEKMNADGDIEEQEISFMTFRMAAVFDVSQTEGEELPEVCIDLTGTVEGYEKAVEGLKQIAPAPIEFKDIQGGAHGYCTLTGDKIAIQSGMSEKQTLKTMIHEVAHSMLHVKGSEQEDADRSTMEVQAEAVAYTVCKAMGLDASDYSFGYIAGWSSGKDAKELIASLETIRKTAAMIIDAVA